MRLNQLLAGVALTERRAGDVECSGICYDTRTMVPGCLFVALPGYKTDGHKYIAQALEQGAAAVLCQHPPEGEGPWLVTPDARAALAAVSANWFGHPARDLTLLAVTGTNGKTTTTCLIKDLLERVLGTKAGLIGTIENQIGALRLPAHRTTPESCEVQQLLRQMADAGCTHVVMEVSSHALVQHRVEGLTFAAGVFTNLTQDHLDYHHTMEEYVQAKKNIFLHQSPEDRLILNFDNPGARSMASEAVCPVTWFSRKWQLDEGVYLRDEAIWLTNEQGSREVLPLELIQLPGDHNIENYMAAIAAVDGLVPDKCVRAVALRFKGVEHRIEFVRELDGVRWYNDSIGTSPTRTTACLESFPQKVILIAGGYDKGVPFTQLGLEIVDRVKTLVLTGDTAPAIRQAVEQADGYGPHTPDIFMAGDLAGAVKEARAAAQPGDIVVLSPACAAFDRFKNFMERGQVFKQLVQEL